MKIKAQHSLDEYRYIVMFDLASHVSGICIWDLVKNAPIETDVIKITGTKYELQIAELYEQLDSFFQNLKYKGIKLSQVLVYKEAMPSQLHGGNSTVQTFLSLSKSHAILDLYTYQHNIAIYDYIGVYPVSTHSYLRKLNNWDNKRKIEKQDTKDFIIKTYNNLPELTFDEADAVFLAKTFIEIKWNKDLDEEIKAVKRHAKELKSEKGVNTCLDEIKRLESLKRR